MNENEKLKIAADFIGVSVEWSDPPGAYFTSDLQEKAEHFDPDGEVGLHWVRRMEKKLDYTQWSLYVRKMCGEYESIEMCSREHPVFRWFKMAPAKLCFDKIIEVLLEEGN